MIGPTIQAQNMRRTVLIGDDIVIEYGPFVQENEAHALILQGKNEIGRVPQLCAMYHKNNKLCIVLERKLGCRLAEIWDNLGQDNNYLLDLPTQRRLLSYKTLYRQSTVPICYC